MLGNIFGFPTASMAVTLPPLRVTHETPARQSWQRYSSSPHVGGKGVGDLADLGGFLWDDWMGCFSHQTTNESLAPKTGKWSSIRWLDVEGGKNNHDFLIFFVWLKCVCVRGLDDWSRMLWDSKNMEISKTCCHVSCSSSWTSILDLPVHHVYIYILSLSLYSSIII